jgi:hypothetical protein
MYFRDMKQYYRGLYVPWTFDTKFFVCDMDFRYTKSSQNISYKTSVTFCLQNLLVRYGVSP